MNPDNPGDTVIEPGLTADLWFGLIPLVFVVIGGGGMYFSTVGSARFSRPTSVKSTTTGATYTAAVRGSGSATLRPKSNRGTRLAAVIVFGLIWNGFLALFLYEIVSLSRRGGFPWFLALFLVPFVAVGIGFVALAIYQALQLSNPRPKVTVSNVIVALGDELRVDWSMEGRLAKLRRFSITLEAREEATHTRGTDSFTDTNVFAAIPLVNQVSPEITRAGSATVRIPADTMHSFDASHNKVVWLFRVRGEMSSWPNSDDEYPLTVAPHHR